MHIISNEISTKNRLVMGEVTHKIIYMLVPLKFYPCGTNLTFKAPTRPHVWTTNKIQYMHTINQMGMVTNQERSTCSDAF